MIDADLQRVRRHWERFVAALDQVAASSPELAGRLVVAGVAELATRSAAVTEHVFATAEHLGACDRVAADQAGAMLEVVAAERRRIDLVRAMAAGSADLARAIAVVDDQLTRLERLALAVIAPIARTA